MYYAKIINGEVIKFPFHMADLITENPNVSFPETQTLELFASYNVYPVTRLPEPNNWDSRTQKLFESTELNNVEGNWVVGWDIVEKTEEEISYYDAQTTEFVRRERTRRLAETDWMALSDVILSSEWAEYRQALRDVPTQEGFPFNIIWPTPPGD